MNSISALEGLRLSYMKPPDSFPSQEELNEMVLDIHRSRLQVVLHAIEEKTIEAACSAIEYALQRFPNPDHRHRIEHCSVCTQPLAKRLSSLGIIVVTQPSFIYYNGERYLRTVPDTNLKHLYPIATLIKNGVKVVAVQIVQSPGQSTCGNLFCRLSKGRKRRGSFCLKKDFRPLEALSMFTDKPAKTYLRRKEQRIDHTWETC